MAADRLIMMKQQIYDSFVTVYLLYGSAGGHVITATGGRSYKENSRSYDICASVSHGLVNEDFVSVPWIFSPDLGFYIEGVVEFTQWIEKMETVFRISNCSVENQIKLSTCTLLGNALTWWNSHVRTVGNHIAYAMTWTELKNKITDKMFPEESDKIEKYVGGLPDMIHRSVEASKPKTMQEATEMAIEVIDNRIHTFAVRQTNNKRKPDNNQQPQQHHQNKR
ncbi:hypothetical protein Tco_1027202 [Tanacetum coccineum]